MVSRESVERTGVSRSLIVVVAAIIGVMMGVFFTFFSEFLVLVRAQLKEGAAE